MPRLVEIAPGLYISQYSHEEVKRLSSKPLSSEWERMIRENQFFTEEQKDDILDPEKYRQHMFNVLEYHCEEHHPYPGREVC